jgi:amidase
MQRDLVPEEVEIDPGLGAAALGAAEHAAVERPRRVEIGHVIGQMEARSHGPLMPCRAARVHRWRNAARPAMLRERPEGTMAPDDITDMDALALSAAIHARTVSCREVMQAFLAAIARLNPTFNAIVALRPEDDLLAEAAAADAELAAGRSRGWMHGMPQAIKDLAEAAGLPCTEGSPIHRGRVSTLDDPFVARMRAAGAIFIGKTNTPEFGLGSQTFNPVWGATRNAYDPALTAGGSSGGAAVALALRLLPVADGSDHAGSLRNPAAFNNVLGLRPGFGRVVDQTDEVFLPRLAVAGPMARTVADLAALLATQAGPDPRAPLSLDEDPERFRAADSTATSGACASAGSAT